MVRVTEIELIDRIYLVGAPGIGKTEIVKQKAMEEAKSLGRIFVDLREVDDEKIADIMRNPGKYYVFLRVPATHIMPEDFAIPLKVTDANVKYYEHLPPKVFAILSLPNIYGVLFLDEINNVQREDQITALFSLIQERQVGWTARKLSANVKIVAAGNPQEWSPVANPLPLPLRMGRLITIEVEPPTVDEWIVYMNRTYGDGWDKRVAAYLKLFPGDFIGRPPAEDDGLSAYPSPRSWTTLALTLTKVKNVNFAVEVAYGLLGKEVGARFESVLRAYVDESDLEAINKNPATFSEIKSEAKKIVILAAVANDPLRHVKLLKYLAARERDYFVIAFVMMSRENKQKIVTDREILQAMRDVLNVLKDYL